MNDSAMDKPAGRILTNMSSACLGATFGSFSYIVAILVTMVIVLRKSENARQVVDLAWSTYVLIAALISIVLLCVGTAFMPKKRSTLYFVIGMCWSVVICILAGLGLMRRDLSANSRT